jgi:hypothetical protein
LRRRNYLTERYHMPPRPGHQHALVYPQPSKVKRWSQPARRGRIGRGRPADRFIDKVTIMTSEHRPLRSFFLLGILLAIAGAANSHTWHVAQDGSGDFTVIQDAVDAAQDGDTIWIGSGHYTEFTVVPGYGQHPDGGFVNVMLDGTKSLTFLGADSEATIIGPLEYAPAYSRSQFGFLCAPGNATIRVENLRVVNQDFRGLGFLNQLHVELYGVQVEMCHIGVHFHYVNNALIEGCVFVNSPHEGASEPAILSRAHTVVIRDTVVDNYWGGVFFSVGSTDVLVDNCQIIDAIVGVSFTQNASGVVQNCYLSGHQNYAIVAGDAGTVVIRNNVIEDSGAGIGFHGAESYTVHDNIVQRCGICVFIGKPNTSQLVYNNHFLRYPEAEDGFFGYYIRTATYYPFGPYYFDFTNNYWGTTDPDEISTWIYDGHDNPNVWMYVVFEPMADGPVPTQHQTWTEVKALFRP